MGTNRYTNLTPSDFNPLSLQEIMMVPLAKQKKHDTILNDIVKNGVFDVNRLSVDDSIVNENITGLKDRLAGIEDDLLEKGVSGGLSKRLLQLKRDREQFLSNDGIGGKAQNAYNAYNQNVKSVRGNRYIRPQDADKYLQYALSRYTDSGGVDAGELYNAYNGAASVAIGDKSRQIASQMKPQDITRILRRHGIVRNTKELTPQDIEQATLYSLMTDNDTMAYVKALSESTGEDHMSILRGAAKSAGLVYERDDRHDRPLPDNTKKARAGRTKKQTPKAGLVAFEGDVTTLKKRFGSLDNLKRVAGDINHPGAGYAQRAIDKMTSHALMHPKSQKMMSKIKEGMADLPNELKETGNLVEWGRAVTGKVIGKAEGEEIDGKYYITAIAGDSSVDVFEVDAQAYDEFQKGIYGNITHENLTQQMKRGNVQGRTAVKSKTSMHTPESIASIDEYFDKTGAPSTKYTFENLKSTDRKFINDNTFNLITSGSLDNFELVNIFSGEEGEGLEIDDELTLKKKKEMFDVLKSGNVTEKEVKHIYLDNYSGVPTARISFMKNSADGKNNRYYEMDVAVDKLTHRSGVKSGEFALLNSLKQYGGKQGQIVHDYMSKAIRYKDVLENYDIDDYDNSTKIKQALPEKLFGKNSLFKETDSFNIYNNDGDYHLMIKGEDGSDRALKWNDIISSDKLTSMSPKKNPDFYKSIIKYAQDAGYVDKNLTEVITYDDQGNGKFDGKKMDDIIKTIIDFDEPLVTKDKVVLMNILNSKR